MKHWHEERKLENVSSLMDDVFTESTIFFDIETTGFSPSKSSLYLIGCSTRKGTQLFVEQFFAENPSEEKEVLLAFFQHLAHYRTILSFHGLGFDIPYLKGKCAIYQIPDPFSEHDFLDLFKEVSHLKFLLRLENYKQKTLEQFLQLKRNDIYDGGQLIPVYQNYLNTKDAQKEQLLKLHNFEDVVGMTQLLSILSYHRFFDGKYELNSCELHSYENFNHTKKEEELLFSLTLSVPVPQRVSYRFDDCTLVLSENKAYLTVKVKQGVLKFFFPNYKDYFYLPQEDMAIHKSVATFVDKEFREKAKASNCYQKKSGRFLPQYEQLHSPAYQENFKDKITYFELTNDFLEKGELCLSYVQHLISVMYN